MLTLFLRRRGQILSRTVLADHVWNMSFGADSNVVEVSVRRLRAKIDDPFAPQAAAQRARHGLRDGGPHGMTTGPTRAALRSIRRRLSRTLLLVALLGLALLSLGLYAAVGWKLAQQQQAELDRRVVKLSDIAQKAQRDGADLPARLAEYAPRRPGTRLTVFGADGRTLYADADLPAHELGEHVRERRFAPQGVSGAMSALRFRLEIDVGAHAELQRSLALMLVAGVLLAAAGVGAAALWAVRRELRPLATLTQQVGRIEPQRLTTPLALGEPIEELQPWVAQFNHLLARLDQAYSQLENFNADVAHELRTPLANIIGQTQVALGRERSAVSLRETLESNLEEAQRLASIVHDMLFLSRADRGTRARRGEPVSVAAVLSEVFEFHEAALEDRQLRVALEGDAQLPLDAPLVRRAVSNLLSNATRHAAPGSTIRVSIEASDARHVALGVENVGPAIATAQLPRIFDRFYRADGSRADGDSHQGLGLAIVAAIARMHGGGTFARSGDGITRIGFSLQR